MDAATRAQYLADDPPTIVPLVIKPHFEALSGEEQKYAHYISVACFAGTRIVLRQCSPESEAIYDFILAVHDGCSGDYGALKSKAGLSDEDLKHYLSYAAMFLGNAGNYKSFGDSKFIPKLSLEELEAIAKAFPSAANHFQQCQSDFYETKTSGHMNFGYPPKGLSAYYPDSPNITEAEIAQIADLLKAQQLLPENTRLKKLPDGNFECLVASAVTSPLDSERDTKQTSWQLDGNLKDKTVTLVFGDHAKEMNTVSEALTEAKKYAANKNQAAMQGDYIKSFHTGSMEAHKESQRHWVQDKGPTVETNIGFIETYRDPHGIRGEWEGFVAMVNKERTKAFGKLVESAPKLIPKLPWSEEFEKETFLSPDFTSLEVLSFAGSGIPAGINIPNYDDIRQRFGFKNVSLGNVLSAKPPDEKVPFIRDEDQDVYQKRSNEAFEVQVGLHELLGHGCGKLLQETESGKFNFDTNNPPVSPLTGKPITSWYKLDETWGSKFGGLGPTIEECRAECVAMFLCCDFGILKIFGFGDGKVDLNNEAGDILYSSYLSMARAGIAALQFWEPSARKWGQAHMQGRYAIFKTFLAAGGDACRMDYETQPDGTITDLTIFLDRTKIISHLRPAVEKFLQKIQIYKATADFAACKEMYEDITGVDDFWATKVRPEVLRRAQPRKVFVQANTILEGNKVTLKEYPATAEGMIQSYADRTYI